MKKHKELASDYFDRHPSSNECHITADGRVFHTKGSAQGFARTLDDQDIESYFRTVLEKEKSLEDAMVIHSDNREEKIKELEELELVKENYPQLKALAKYFDIKPADQKADTLIAALTEFKTTLNS